MTKKIGSTGFGTLLLKLKLKLKQPCRLKKDSRQKIKM